MSDPRIKDAPSLPKLSILNLIGAVDINAVEENVTVTPHNVALNNGGVANSRPRTKFSIINRMMSGTEK